MLPRGLVRPLRSGDASILAALAVANRDFLAPYDPVRPPEYFTTDGQRRLVAAALRRCDEGRGYPFVILAEGEVVGRVNLNNVVRGASDSADLGYWLDQGHNGAGLATQAVAAVTEHAFGDLGLHRLQAGTLLDNHRSQRVLERTGFEPIGMAARYLRIAGRWRDHLLFQRTAD